MTIKSRRFRLWYIPLALIIFLSAFVAGARSVGTTSTSLFDCTILTNSQDSNIVAVDAGKGLRAEVKASLSRSEEIGSSPDGSYTLYARTYSPGDDAATTIFVRTNATGQMVDLPDLDVVGNVYWSPNNGYVIAIGLMAAQHSKVLILARANGTDAHAVDLPSIDNLVWSGDSQYIAFATADGIVAEHIADLAQTHIPEKPQGGIQWLPGTHTLLYTWNDDTLSIYNVDSQAESSTKFALQDGSKLGYSWTPDAHFLAVYQDNGSDKGQLKLFDISDGKLRELQSDASSVRFLREFWTPDNQAIALVTAPTAALVAYSLKDGHSEALIPGGFRDLMPALDGNRYLFTRQHNNGLSLDLIDFTTGKLSVIKDDITYIWPTQSDKSFFTVQSKDNLYSVDLLNAETGDEQRIIDNLPDLPLVQESGSAVAIVWETPSGGGLARYSLIDKHLAYYHVDLEPHWTLVKTLIAFSPDLRQVAVGVQEQYATMLQLAYLDDTPPLTLYQSSDGKDWVGILNWSADSSELLYGIDNGGPAKLARSDGLELRIFSQHEDVSYSTCGDYFRN